MGPLEMLRNCVSTLPCILELENESYSISDRLWDPLGHTAAFFEGLQPPRVMSFPATHPQTPFLWLSHFNSKSVSFQSKNAN